MRARARVRPESRLRTRWNGPESFMDIGPYPCNGASRCCHRPQEELERRAEKSSKQKFQTPLGERLYDAMYGWQDKKVDNFLPGRIYYVIDFDESAGDVPITQYRPKHEVPH